MQARVRRAARIPTVRYGHEDIEAEIILTENDIPTTERSELTPEDLLDRANLAATALVEREMERVYQDLQAPSGS